MQVSEQASIALGLTMYVCWALAYILMIRRAFKDQCISVPLTVACLNVSWEGYFTFLADMPAQYRMQNAFVFIFDVGVLFICYKFGAKEFDWPILKGRFKMFLTIMLGASFLLIHNFVAAFNDSHGALSASLCVIAYSTFFVVMLMRRNAVAGQSIYIGLLILVGDIAGYFPTLYAAQTGIQDNLSVLWIKTVFGFAFILHAFYVGLFWRIATQAGINPWKRL